MAWVENLKNREIEEWIAWYNIEPFGDVRSDLRAALQTAHAVAPYLKKGHKPKLGDYMLDFEPKKQMTPDEIKSVLLMMPHG